MFDVTRVVERQPVQDEVVIDYYVPVAFTSQSTPVINSKWIQLGAHDNEFFEIEISEKSLLTQFTLLSIKSYDAGEIMGEGPVRFGLPEIKEREQLSYSGFVPRARIVQKIAVLRSKLTLDIVIEVGLAYDSMVVYGRVLFLLRGQTLIGIRVGCISDEESETLDLYFKRVSQRTFVPPRVSTDQSRSEP